MPAGPSEVLVVADAAANPAHVAADLLSQAEHGPDSQVGGVGVKGAWGWGSRFSACQCSGRQSGMYWDMGLGRTLDLSSAWMHDSRQQPGTSTSPCQTCLLWTRHDMQVVLLALPGTDVSAIGREVERQCSALPRNETARKALTHSFAVEVGASWVALYVLRKAFGGAWVTCGG